MELRVVRNDIIMCKVEADSNRICVYIFNLHDIKSASKVVSANPIVNYDDPEMMDIIIDAIEKSLT